MARGVKILAAVLAVALSGCATYTYNNQKFRNQADALAYQDKHLSTGVNNLKPTDTKVGGTLKIYYPNQDVVRAKTITGNSRGAVGDYLVAATMADVAKIKQAFERRKAFDTVELNYSQGEHRKPEPTAHVLYLYVESPQVIGWYYIGSAVPKSPIAFDRGTTDMGEKYRLFVESVESLAMAEKVATRK